MAEKIAGYTSEMCQQAMIDELKELFRDMKLSLIHISKFIAADLDAARGDYEKMQVFVNTNLGLQWEEPGETVESAALLARREFYEAEVPDGVIYLTAGVDTQDNRFEIEVAGSYTHLGAALLRCPGRAAQKSGGGILPGGEGVERAALSLIHI